MQLLLHPSDQPIFRLCGSITQCRLEVRINDVPVLRDSTGLAHTFDLAINEWLFQGSNRIDVHLQPTVGDAPFGPKAGFQMKMRYKPARDAVRNQVDVGEMDWKYDPAPAHGHLHGVSNFTPDDTLPDDFDDGAPLLALPGQAEELIWKISESCTLPDKSVQIGSQLPLPPPWPVCPWSRGVMLAVNSGTHHAVNGMLRSLHHTLNHGGWQELLKTRRAAIQAAYYLGGDEVDAALGFPPLLSAHAWQLQPLPEETLTLELAGGGKLARLVEPATSEAPLVLINSKAGVTASVEAWWMFSGEWTLVR